MRTYVKNKPAWLQLIIFGAITFWIALIGSLLGFFLVAYINHINISKIFSISELDFSKPENAPIAKGMLVVQFFALFLLPSLVFASIADPKPLQFAGLKKPDKMRYILLGVLIILCSYLMVEWLGILNEQLVQALLGKKAQHWIEKGENDVGGTLLNILTMKNPADLIKSIVLVGVLAAVGEELFFRGILQRIFIQIFKKPWIGIVFTAAIFSAIHGQFLGFIPRMILGIILGYLYWYSGSLLPAMLGHFVFNSFQVILLYNKMVNINQTSSVSDKLLPMMGIVATLIVIALLYYMRKHSITTYSRVYQPTYVDMKHELIE
jgi:membrane protease YdiL (CAAX protease family)